MPPHWQQKVFAPMTALALLVVLITVVIYGGIYFQNQKIIADTVSWKYRAQVAANPYDMEEYLTKCVAGMKKWRMTNGYDAFINKRPDNDMHLIMLSLDSAINGTRDLEPMDHESAAYRTGMDDLRGVIREIDIHSPSAWWVLNCPWGLFLWWVFYPLTLAVLAYWLFVYYLSDTQLEIAEKKRQEEEKERARKKEEEGFEQSMAEIRGSHKKQ